MTHVICRLTAKNRDQPRNPTIGNRVWATFTFLLLIIVDYWQRTTKNCICRSFVNKRTQAKFKKNGKISQQTFDLYREKSAFRADRSDRLTSGHVSRWQRFCPCPVCRLLRTGHHHGLLYWWLHPSLGNADAATAADKNRFSHRPAEAYEFTVLQLTALHNCGHQTRMIVFLTHLLIDWLVDWLTLSIDCHTTSHFYAGISAPAPDKSTIHVHPAVFRVTLQIWPI